MRKGTQLYEGKAKKVYRTDDERFFVIEYKDDATAFNGEKKGTVAGKGVVNNRMSNILFRMLESHGVETHFVEELNDRETVVKAVRIVPLEVIVRNVAAGSFSRRFGVEEGMELRRPTLEFCLKDDALGDPMINDSQILALGLADEEELRTMSAVALRVNDLLKDYFSGIGVRLIDFKIELGRYEGRIVLADEISPDTCRFWDAETNRKLDKDRFRRDLGEVEEVYREMLERVSR
ncbi:phosphoribosylaminoimidazolesuccinocarboxamide synthase [Fretibacterium sp. OH1220_COT-178]|uniref:phosphoribosylaminoimidazolesuccinocarboxamide synthase n=1 Tax=Fretibacterium sp. OH1220_COT-178 TaxID=2491047 RepID=UPI000F5EF650|nr:phosphoribosylaminoimidazolesuccinocarboxamide synthase [Fretibacterium sp. OH1220_COT-178]RRD64970.1 phosphoribosylaminoimidazolesuccinocarboxamide synthase [Fretibacterium sp. OH1220_COT-178]